MQNKGKAAPPDSAGDAGATTKAHSSFPRALIKRIIMLDTDQSRVTVDALDITSKAAELFLETLAGKAHAKAAGSARITVNFRDVGVCLHKLLDK
jgi:histone H3/H4